MRCAANFANDKPVRPHPQGLPHEAANRQLARPFDVRRPSSAMTRGCSGRSPLASSTNTICSCGDTGKRLRGDPRDSTLNPALQTRGTATVGVREHSPMPGRDEQLSANVPAAQPCCRRAASVETPLPTIDWRRGNRIRHTAAMTAGCSRALMARAAAEARVCLRPAMFAADSAVSLRSSIPPWRAQISQGRWPWPLSSRSIVQR